MTCNFKNLDASDPNATYSNYPITTGSNSYTIYLRGQYTGTFNLVSNNIFYVSTGSTGSGYYVTTGLNVAYATPTTTSAGDPAAVYVLPGSTNVSGSGTSNPGYVPSGSSVTLTGSQFIRLQMLTSTAASPGDTNTLTFTMQWNEQ